MLIVLSEISALYLFLENGMDFEVQENIGFLHLRAAVSLC